MAMKLKKNTVKKTATRALNPYKAALSGFEDKESKVADYAYLSKGSYLARLDFVQLKITESKGKTIYVIDVTVAKSIEDALGNPFDPSRPRDFKGNVPGDQASIAFVKNDVPAFFFRDIRRFLSSAFNCDPNEDIGENEVYFSSGIDPESFEPMDDQPCAGILIEVTVTERAKKNPTEEEKASGKVKTYEVYEFGDTLTTEEAQEALGDDVFNALFEEGRVNYIKEDDVEEGEVDEDEE